VHLRRARVHEAHVDARAGQAADQGLRPDHRDPPGGKREGESPLEFTGSIVG
jgi:hypothetical protein